MEIPSLNETQFAVGKAEYATGIVLRNDGSIFQTGEDLNKMYEIFESCEEAKEFALQKIKVNPGIECWIVNSKGNHIITYDKDGERKFSK
jgi:predicted transcriptional regulator